MAEEFLKSIQGILLKYRANITPDMMQEWVRDLKHAVQVLTKEFHDRGMNYAGYDEVCMPYINHLLDVVPAIANAQLEASEAIFRLLGMHEALSSRSPQIAALFSTERQLIRTRMEDVEGRLVEKELEVLEQFHRDIRNDDSPATPTWEVIGMGDEIHPLTTEVINYVRMLVSRSDALNVLFQHGHGGRDDELGERVRLLLDSLQLKLREKADSYGYTPVGNGFLYRNWNHVMESVGVATLRQIVGDNWFVDQEQVLSDMEFEVYRSSVISALRILGFGFF